MRKIIITAFLLSIILLTGCEIESTSMKVSDENLIKFLPVLVDEFSGDGDYYHISKNIEIESSKDIKTAVITGEVKNNFIGGTGAEYNYTMRLTVTDEALVQTYSGSRLNESDFDEVVLLKLPLEINRSWTFTTQNKAGQKQKVTATIQDIFNSGKGVKVRYETKDGYFEERTLYEGHGVVDFVRQVMYKDESSVTGYHSAFKIPSSDLGDDLSAIIEPSSNNEVNTSTENTDGEEENEQEFPLKVIEIPVAYYNLILGFEQAWVNYITNESDDLLKFVDVDTPAYIKIDAVERPAETGMSFVKYYPYELSIDGDFIIINIVETFSTEENSNIKNKVSYTISNAATLPKIYDFEVIK